MNRELISGVYAATVTNRLNNGTLDTDAFKHSLMFLLRKGIQGFALNGATGEYCLTTPRELTQLMEIARKLAGDNATLLCGIGSASVQGCLENGRRAIQLGALGLLLPAAHFFQYGQEDVEAFCREVARQLPAPILLYNLPQFTTGLETSTVMRLFSACPNIAGIKDSSGSLDILRRITQDHLPARRLVGNDAILAEALRENICDGVISGVAGVLPELVEGLFELRNQPHSAEFIKAEVRLGEFLEAIKGFPVPWTLKWIAECRGIAPATFAQPIAPQRAEKARILQHWFLEWMPDAKAG